MVANQLFGGRKLIIIDYHLLVLFIFTTITIAAMSIYINHIINKPQVSINRNKKCVTIHKIKSQFSYAIISENNKERITVNESEIKGLIMNNEAIYNSD